MIDPGLAALAVPVLAQARRCAAKVMANYRREMTPIGRGPLLGKHDIVMSGGAERPWVILLCRAMPELEEPDRDIAAEGIDIAGGERIRGVRRNHEPMSMLRGRGSTSLDEVAGEHIDAIRTIDAVGIQDSMVE
jgi:hypothetical protein